MVAVRLRNCSGHSCEYSCIYGYGWSPGTGKETGIGEVRGTGMGILLWSLVTLIASSRYMPRRERIQVKVRMRVVVTVTFTGTVTVIVTVTVSVISIGTNTSTGTVRD